MNNETDIAHDESDTKETTQEPSAEKPSARNREEQVWQ